MYKPTYGDPVVTLRLPRQMVAAAKIAAKRHDTTLSGLMRRLLVDQLRQDGITWQDAAESIPGQQTLDDISKA